MATAGSKKCPICERAVRPRAENPSFPFCGARCKTIDLGKWMAEEYRIPAGPPRADDEEEDEAGSRGGGSENRH